MNVPEEIDKRIAYLIALIEDYSASKNRRDPNEDVVDALKDKLIRSVIDFRSWEKEMNECGTPHTIYLSPYFKFILCAARCLADLATEEEMFHSFRYYAYRQGTPRELLMSDIFLAQYPIDEEG